MLYFEIHGVSIRMSFARAHLASLDARGFICMKYAGVGHGTVGYADRSARCVSPLMPFCLFAPEAYSGGEPRRFLLIYGVKRCRKQGMF